MKLFKIFSPVAIFAITWLSVIALFACRFSDLLQEPLSDAILFFFASLFFFGIGYTFVFLFRKKVNIAMYSVPLSESILKRYKKFVTFWVILTFVEIVYSGGIPLIWLFTGSDKTYFDFGIPSIHGFLNALELTLGQLSFYFYNKTKNKKYLGLTIFFIVWNIIVISRQVIIVLLIEVFVIFFTLAKNKVTLFKTLLIYAFVVVFCFGVVGDLRSGADNFIALALPSDNWPTWLPSGFLWVYIYITTPINNLLHNFHFNIPAYNFLFPNTLSLLLPSIVRNLLYNNKDTVSGDLVSEAFNVSTAFMSSYMDLGYYGVLFFAFLIGGICNITWWVTGPKRLFFRAVTTQCIILSIFYNHFFYLPVAFQYMWLFVFFYKTKHVSN